jgi:hypothetical protein
MLKVGMRVRNVRRPDNIGVVVSLDAPNNKWSARPQDLRVMVKYQRVTKLSNGTWKGGVLDELPIDLLPTGVVVHEAFSKYKRSGDEPSNTNRIHIDRIKRRKRA